MNARPTGDKAVTGSRLTNVREWIQLITAALDAAPNSIVITDDHGTIKWVNPAFTKDTGYTFEEAVGQNPRILKSGKQEDSYYAEMWRTISGGNPWHGEFVNKRKNGEFFTEDVTVAPVRDPEGVVRHFIAIKYDITSRRRTEGDLRLFRTLVDASEDSFEVIDPPTGRFLDIGLGHCAKLGYTRAEMLALRVSDIDPTIKKENWPIHVEKLRASGTLVGEGRHRRKDGTVFPVEYHSKLVQLDRAYIITVVHDITGRKLLEEQLFRAQRLESLGMLAAGIAHDLNNILSPIAMSVPLLRVNASVESDRHVLDTLENCTKRGAGLVRQILNFVHGIGGEPIVVDVGHLLRDIVAVLGETFPKSIAIEQDLQRDLWPILANPTQIHQVLLNLCVNARDAMPEGGKLRLRSENCVLDKSSVLALKAGQPGLDVTPGDWVVLQVGDTGSGIAPSILSRIWEPFFTTKSPSKGTGLGLSTVATIIRTHHGFCTLQTEQGCGSTFRIYLPAADSPNRSSNSPFSAPAPRGADELILLVDDEQPILETVGSILTQGGYRVITARNGVQASEIFGAKCDEIGLVITDQDMPELDGLGLLRFVQKLKPGFKVLVMSGLSGGNPLVPDEELAAPFLSKPFTSQELLKEIYRLLHGKSATI